MTFATLRTFRAELAVLAVVASVAGAAVYYVAWRLEDLGRTLRSCREVTVCSPAVEELTQLAVIAAPLLVAITIALVLTTVVIGSQVVAGEVERGTAEFAWSVAVSRQRWLIERSVILGAAIAIACLLPALSTAVLVDQLTTAGLGSVAALLPLAGARIETGVLLAFAVSVLVGTFSRQMISAALGAAIAVSLSLAAVTLATDELYSRNLTNMAPDDVSGVIVERLYRDADGSLVDEEHAQILADSHGMTLEEAFSLVVRALPLPAISSVRLQVATVEAGLALVSVGTAAIAIRSRSPR